MEDSIDLCCESWVALLSHPLAAAFIPIQPFRLYNLSPFCRGLKAELSSFTVEVAVLLRQEILTLPSVGQRLSALGLWGAFLPAESDS